jgi:hypothetical protein
MVPVSGGYYTIVKTDGAYNAILNDFEKWLGERDGWWEVHIDRVALGQLLRMTFKLPDVCPRDLTPEDFRMRKDAARGALLLQGGKWLQFDNMGNAMVSHRSLEEGPYPIFFKAEVNNAEVDIDALERHISGVQLVDYSRLQGLIWAILASKYPGQADCFVHILARVLANQPDAFKKVLFLYGTAREVGKSLLAHIMKTLLGISDGVWKCVGADIKKVFTTETQDSQSILKATKEYTSQAVVVLEEVGAAGNEVYNRNNKPVVFNALKTKQDGTTDVYILKKKTEYTVANRCCFILTGNTESAMDAFTGISPGDATRVHPLHCGNSNVSYKEGDEEYDRRYEAAKTLYEACKTDRKPLFLEFLALIVDYAKVPLATMDWTGQLCRHHHVRNRNSPYSSGATTTLSTSPRVTRKASHGPRSGNSCVCAGRTFSPIKFREARVSCTRTPPMHGWRSDLGQRLIREKVAPGGTQV